MRNVLALALVIGAIGVTGAAASGPTWEPDPFDNPCEHYAKYAPQILELYGDRMDCTPPPAPTRLALLADDDTLRRFVFDEPSLPPAIPTPWGAVLLLTAFFILYMIKRGSRT